jgi:hypothetical protein
VVAGEAQPKHDATPQLIRVDIVFTAELLKYAGAIIDLTADQDRHAVIEKPYVGRGKKTSIALSITTGQIKQALEMIGFRVHWALTYPEKRGDTTWLADMLMVGKTHPPRKQLKQLSIIRAKADYSWVKKPTHHEADAINIGTWWLNKQQWVAVELKRAERHGTQG